MRTHQEGNKVATFTSVDGTQRLGKPWDWSVRWSGGLAWVQSGRAATYGDAFEAAKVAFGWMQGVEAANGRFHPVLAAAFVSVGGLDG